MARAVAVALVGMALLLAGCAGGAGPDASGVTQGQRLYEENCQRCHGDSQGRGRVAPAPPHGLEGHTWHHADQLLADIVLRGSREVYGSGAMPAFQDRLTEEEVTAILAYIKTWWTQEQRDSQERATEAVRQQESGL